MGILPRIWATAGVAIPVMLLSSCIAPDVDVIGAIGVTVDEDARPVLVIEACDGAAVLVSLSLNREGLADDEENEQIASWTASKPVRGRSTLAVHAPAAPWDGPGVEIEASRGYVSGGQGKGDGEVLTQVAFSGEQLAGMETGVVYRNDSDPDVAMLVAATPEEFSRAVCSR